MNIKRFKQIILRPYSFQELRLSSKNIYNVTLKNQLYSNNISKLRVPGTSLC